MATKRQEWLTVSEFLERHKGLIGRSSVYDRIRDHTIPSVRLGKKILVPADALERLLDSDS